AEGIVAVESHDIVNFNFRSVDWPIDNTPSNWSIAGVEDEDEDIINQIEITITVPEESEGSEGSNGVPGNGEDDNAFELALEGDGAIRTFDWSSHQRAQEELEEEARPDGVGRVQDADNPEPLEFMLVEVEFDKDPVIVGLGENRTSETEAFPATDPPTYPHRLIATIVPKDAEDMVTFESSDETRITVSEEEDSRSEEGNTTEVIVKVEGISMTPEDSPDGDADVRALIDNAEVATTKAVVIKPTSRAHEVGPLEIANTATLIKNETETEIQTYYEVIVTITIFDQFGNQLDAIYNGTNVVEEKFVPIQGGGFVTDWVPITFPDNELIDGEKRDQVSDELRMTLSWPLPSFEIQNFEAEEEVQSLQGANNTRAYLNQIGVKPAVQVDEAKMLLRVDGHEVNDPEITRRVEHFNRNHPPDPFVVTDE
ncbi:MAG: hypothetical protein LAT55_13435, partial [Opitutales bacterium]|nr:hypothetical protein [Opitutales bacterium]